jgi:uncharacterized protein (TIGR02444 family)
VKAWDFACDIYSRDGVKAATLELQDQGGQCVSLLLWRLWAAVEGRAVDAARLNQAISVARTVENDILRPSRRLRGGLTATTSPIDGTAQAQARDLYLKAELAAERGLIERLEALAGKPDAAASDALTCLEETARAWGGAPCRKLLVRLADAC